MNFVLFNLVISKTGLVYLPWHTMSDIQCPYNEPFKVKIVNKLKKIHIHSKVISVSDFLNSLRVTAIFTSYHGLVRPVG